MVQKIPNVQHLVENVLAIMVLEETNVMFVKLNILDFLLVKVCIFNRKIKSKYFSHFRKYHSLFQSADVMSKDQLIRHVIIMENVLAMIMFQETNVQYVLLDMMDFQLVTSAQHSIMAIQIV